MFPCLYLNYHKGSNYPNEAFTVGFHLKATLHCSHFIYSKDQGGNAKHLVDLHAGLPNSW